MLWACVIDYGGNWVEHLPLIKLAYNNSYHFSIGMATFEHWYGRRVRDLIGWFELSEVDMFGMDFLYKVIEKVKVIQDRLNTAQSYQKSFVDVRNRDLGFEVGDKVFLKVSPIKEVIGFGKKGKISPWFFSLYAFF